MDLPALGASLNLNMKCWETLLPHVVRHPLLRLDLMPVLQAYQRQYAGANVFRLWGRLSHRRFRRTGARRLPRHRANRAMNPATSQVVVAGGFDDIRSKQIRFLEEAAKLGELTVLLWTDAAIQRLTGQAPKFPLAERQYFLERIRYVHRVVVIDASAALDTLPPVAGGAPQIWVVPEAQGNAAQRAFCAARGWEYRVLSDRDLSGFPVPAPAPSIPARQKVVVTGCYDWFHTGHVRFLRGSERLRRPVRGGRQRPDDPPVERGGSPADHEAERRYVVGSVRFVTQR